mgnify:CR=1 FL=1
MLSYSVGSSSFSGGTWYTVRIEGLSTVSQSYSSARTTCAPPGPSTVLRTFFSRHRPSLTKRPGLGDAQRVESQVAIELVDADTEQGHVGEQGLDVDERLVLL